VPADGGGDAGPLQPGEHCLRLGHGLEQAGRRPGVQAAYQEAQTVIPDPAEAATAISRLEKPGPQRARRNTKEIPREPSRPLWFSRLTSSG